MGLVAGLTASEKPWLWITRNRDPESYFAGKAGRACFLRSYLQAWISGISELYGQGSVPARRSRWSCWESASARPVRPQWMARQAGGWRRRKPPPARPSPTRRRPRCRRSAKRSRASQGPRRCRARNKACPASGASHHRADLLRHIEQRLAEHLVADGCVQARVACGGVGIAPVLLHEAALGEACGAVDVQQELDRVEHLLGREP